MPREWEFSCLDASGRRKKLVLVVRNDRVVVVTPPGESASLEPLTVGHLRAALREAAVWAAVGVTDETPQPAGDE